MPILTITIFSLAVYGLLALLFQTFHRHDIADNVRYGGVIDTRTDRTLGYMPPELRENDHKLRAATAALAPRDYTPRIEE